MDILNFVKKKYAEVCMNKSMEKTHFSKDSEEQKRIENLIILEAKNGNQLAFNLLIKCYHKMIMSALNDIGVREGHEKFDDYYVDSLMILSNCVKNYNPNFETDSEKGPASFSTFLYQGLENQKKRFKNKEKKEQNIASKLVSLDAPLKEFQGSDNSIEMDMYTITSKRHFEEEELFNKNKCLIEKLSMLLPKEDFDIIKLRAGYTNTGKKYTLAEIHKMPAYRNQTTQRLSQKAKKVRKELSEILKHGFRISELIKITTLSEEEFFEELSLKSNINVSWLKYYYLAYQFIYYDGELPKVPSSNRKSRFQEKEFSDF